MFKMDPPKGFDKWFVDRRRVSRPPPADSLPVRRRFTAFDFSPSILPPAHESFVPFLSVPGQVLRERMHRLDDAGQTFAVEFK